MGNRRCAFFPRLPEWEACDGLRLELGDPVCATAPEAW